MNPFARLGLIVAACLWTSSASAAAPSGWKALRNPTGEYVLSYPATMKLLIPTGQSCSMGVCNRIEQVQLTGADGAITLAIQRNINPGHLPLREWYEILASGSHAGGTETVTTLGGHDAVRRRGLAPAETVRYAQGQEVSRHSQMLPSDELFVALNRSDVLTIMLHPRDDAANSKFERVLTTIQFTR